MNTLTIETETLDYVDLCEGARACVEWLHEDDPFMIGYHSEGAERMLRALVSDPIATGILANEDAEQVGHDAYLCAAGTGAGFGDGRWRGILDNSDIEYLCEFLARFEVRFM